MNKVIKLAALALLFMPIMSNDVVAQKKKDFEKAMKTPREYGEGYCAKHINGTNWEWNKIGGE